MDERLKRYLPIRCVIRKFANGDIEGLVENSFSMSWDKKRVNIFWSGKAYSILGEHDLDGVSWAEHNCKHTEPDLFTPEEIVVDPLTEDSPIKVDWDKWLMANNKYDKRNAPFEVVPNSTRRMKMNNTKDQFAYGYASFTNREEYLEFRRQWKAAYLGKIQLIRKLKRDLKQAMRDKPYDSHYAIRHAHREAIRDINTMLTDKYNAAREAQRQYLAEKEKHNAVS